MPHYSKTSREQLNTCHNDLQIIFEHVLEGWNTTILEGEREEREQNKYFAQGKTKVKFPDSKHNQSPSMAVDAVPYPIDWDDRERFVGFGCYVLGVADMLLKQGIITHRLRWGGDWNHNDRELTPQNFNDYPHFELVEIT